MSIKEVLKAKVVWSGGMLFTGEDSKGHKIPMEATTRFGGMGKQPIPLEVLLTALGGCIGVDSRYWFAQQGKEYDSLEVTIEGIRKDQIPRTFENIHVKVKLSGDLDDEVVQKTLEQVFSRFCPIAVILGSTSELTWEYELAKTKK